MTNGLKTVNRERGVVKNKYELDQFDGPSLADLRRICNDDITARFEINWPDYEVVEIFLVWDRAETDDEMRDRIIREERELENQKKKRREFKEKKLKQDLKTLERLKIRYPELQSVTIGDYNAED